MAIRRSKDRHPGMGYIPKCRTQPCRSQMLAARKAWQTEAEKQLAERMPQEIQKQLSVEGLPYTAPPDNGD
ncbi:hypothetical protein MTR72_16365 [Bradyrhizobium sp. ISRA442]|uniref:hypothetical protein n=1 Tax=Bradyrhizobium sp. ISRA442 TaxID=2866197 RepID=UPI00311B2AD2